MWSGTQYSMLVNNDDYTRLSLVLKTCYGLHLYSALRVDYGVNEDKFKVETDQGVFFCKRFKQWTHLEGQVKLIVAASVIAS